MWISFALRPPMIISGAPFGGDGTFLITKVAYRGLNPILPFCLSI
jgi:hypothetical protein